MKADETFLFWAIFQYFFKNKPRIIRLFFTHSAKNNQSKFALDLCSQLQGYLGIVHELNIQYHTIIESKKQSSSIIF